MCNEYLVDQSFVKECDKILANCIDLNPKNYCGYYVGYIHVLIPLMMVKTLAKIRLSLHKHHPRLLDYTELSAYEAFIISDGISNDFSVEVIKSWLNAHPKATDQEATDLLALEKRPTSFKFKNNMKQLMPCVSKLTCDKFKLQFYEELISKIL
jgi:hypothetical protein